MSDTFEGLVDDVEIVDETNPLLKEETSEPADKTEEFKAPDGLSEDLFDTQTKSLKQDAVLQAFKKKDEELAEVTKRMNGLRAKLSNGVKVPNTAEEYSKDYKPDEKYTKYYSEETPEDLKSFVKSELEGVDKLALEQHLSIEQAKAVKDAWHRAMENVGLFDTRNEDDIKAEREQFKAQEKAKLGDGAEEIIKRNVNYVANAGYLNQEEKDYLIKKVMNDGALGIRIVDKYRKALHGESYGQDIPVGNSEMTGLGDDYTLAKEYNDPNTSSERRIEITKQRHAAGRKGGLPLVA